MSFLKKVGATVLGTASATGWLAAKGIELLAETAEKNMGKEGYTNPHTGRTVTKADCRNMAQKMKTWQGAKYDESGKKIADNSDDNIFLSGLKAAGKLWNDED